MNKNRKEILADIQNELDDLKASGLFKSERIITTPQSAIIKTNTVYNILAIE